MRNNEANTAPKLKRSAIPLAILLTSLVLVSIVCLFACSGGDDGSDTTRVVQAMVYFDENGPVAVAFVQDENKNYVSDAVLTMNDRPFEVTFDETGIPVYYLELYDLMGGDSLTFFAKRLNGTTIYAPPSSQIPLSMELLEPVSGQTVLPGDEVLVRWAGGDGATHIAVFYGDNESKKEYWNDQEYEDVTSMTIPAGVVLQGGGIIGTAALSGDYPDFDAETGFDAFESWFVVYQDAVLAIDVPVENGAVDFAQQGDGAECPNSPMDKSSASAACTGEFAAIVGGIIWGTRWGIDAGKHPYCPIPFGPFGYCIEYSKRFSHTVWVSGCECPTKPK